jgi:formylglycine-generating enzyme required for sulfatase activity
MLATLIVLTSLQDGPVLRPFTETLPKSTAKVEMIAVPAGKVKIGNKEVEVKPFYIAKTETTWEAFDAFLASGEPSKPYDQTEFAADAVARPSRGYTLPDLGWGHNGYPAINLNYTSVEMYTRWLSSVTKKKYRLATEAEWELACRAGKVGNAMMDLATANKVAWHAGNSKGQTQPVGKMEANAWGIHDMYGNVGEWVLDVKGEPVLAGGTFRDKLDLQIPTARRPYDPDWQMSDPQLPKSRWWLSDGPIVGFRVVCEP